MTAITLESFGGISPLIDNRKLPDSRAQQAQDVVIDGTDLASLTEPTMATGLTAVDLGEVTTGTVTKIVSARSNVGSLAVLRFRGARNYDVVPVPVVNDIWNRVYWTDTGNDNLLYASQFSPSTRRMVGVLPPTTAPTVTDGAPNTAKTVSSISKSATPVVTTSSAHGFTNGQRVAMTVSRGGVAETQPVGMTELSGREFVISNVTATTFQLVGVDTSTLLDLQPGQTASVIRVLRAEDLEDRIYVYTLVSEYGEESQPSPPSGVIQVPLDGGRCNVTINATQQGNQQRSTVTKIRIYRSITGQVAGTNFYFVDEVAFTSSLVYSDSKRSIALGELLPSENWALPPQKLRGLRQMPGGFLVGFVANTLYACEPNLPHAWPDDYRRSIPSGITALETFGGMLAVITEGEPYIAYGNDPAAITLQKMDRIAPCSKPRCIVSTGGGVIYPTYDGLVMVSQAGVQNLTEAIFTREQWTQIVQSADCAAWHDGRYYLFDDASSSGAPTMIFDVEGGMNVTTTTTTSVSAATIDPISNRLLFCHSWDSSGAMRLFDGTATSRESVWTSKLFTAPKPFSPSVVQVLADFLTPGAAVTVEVIPGTFSFPYAEQSTAPQVGYAVASVTSPEPQRLPALAMARDWTIRLRFRGNVGRINGVVVAQSMDEVRGAA